MYKNITFIESKTQHNIECSHKLQVFVQFYWWH